MLRDILPRFFKQEDNLSQPSILGDIEGFEYNVKTRKMTIHGYVFDEDGEETGATVVVENVGAFEYPKIEYEEVTLETFGMEFSRGVLRFSFYLPEWGAILARREGASKIVFYLAN